MAEAQKCSARNGLGRLFRISFGTEGNLLLNLINLISVSFESNNTLSGLSGIN